MRHSISLCICFSSFVLNPLAAQETPKYLDPQVPIEQRIDDLLPRMTVTEKVSQISNDWGSVGIPKLKVPSLLKTEGLDLHFTAQVTAQSLQLIHGRGQWSLTADPHQSLRFLL